VAIRVASHPQFPSIIQLSFPIFSLHSSTAGLLSSFIHYNSTFIQVELVIFLRPHQIIIEIQVSQSIAKMKSSIASFIIVFCSLLATQAVPIPQENHIEVRSITLVNLLRYKSFGDINARDFDTEERANNDHDEELSQSEAQLEARANANIQSNNGGTTGDGAGAGNAAATGSKTSTNTQINNGGTSGTGAGAGKAAATPKATAKVAQGAKVVTVGATKTGTRDLNVRERDENDLGA